MELFENVDPAAVDAAYELVAGLVQEKHPDLEAKKGALSELWCGLHAILQADNVRRIEELRRSLCLSDVLDDPDKADKKAVDALASNYGVSRRPPSYAYGDLVITLSHPFVISIAEGARLTTDDGLEFIIDKTLRLSADDLDKNVDGHYYFLVPVRAAEPGYVYQLAEDTALQPNFRIPGYVSCVAACQFEGGHEEDTNDDVVVAIMRTFATPGFGSAEGLEHLIRYSRDADGHFTDLRQFRIVGAGEPEMERDDGFGGKVDIHIAEGHKVQDLQHFLDQPYIRPLGMDIKVLVAEPCWVDMEIDIDTEGYQSEAVEAATKYVNSLPVGAMLRRSKLVKAINQVLPEDGTVSHVRMEAKLQMTDWKSGAAEIIDPPKIAAMTASKIDCRVR